MTYRNFTIQPVADGVWAALANVNAGIVDLGDRTLIFDTFATLGAARELRAAAEALTGRPATYVVNSHAHADHFNGNAAFDDAVLISSRLTRETLIAQGAAAMGRMKAGMMAQAETFRKQMAEATEAAEVSRLEAIVQDFETFFAEYPTPDDLRIPALAFERQLTITGSKRSVQLISFGGAHSPCDAVLWLPEGRLMFTGDLVIPGENHILSLGTPENWLPILGQLEALGAETLVPGHGKVVPAAEGYAWSRKYLNEIFDVANRLKAEGAGPEVADHAQPPFGCSPLWYRRNLRFLLERSK